MKLIKLLQDFICEIGECVCNEAYKTRNLIDPNCEYHKYEYYIKEIIKYIGGKDG